MGLRILWSVVLLLVAPLVSCGGSDTASATPQTAIRLIPTFGDTWGLTQLELVSGKHRSLVPEEEGTVSSGAAITILLLEPVSDTAMTITVWGLRSQERIAIGETQVLPQLHTTVDAYVTLARLPCGAWCMKGDRGCFGDSVRICEQRDADSCMEWSDPVACPADAPFCSLGQCAAKCINECADGTSRCAGPASVQNCGQNDTDDCTDWGPAEPCPQDYVCDSMQCRPSGTCHDDCRLGETQCVNNEVAHCGQFDNDDCLDFGPPEPCGTGNSCSAGACAPISQCKDECTKDVCESLTYKRCGEFDTDPCKDLDQGTSCVPLDPCYDGICSAESACSSKPKDCNDSPAACPNCGSSGAGDSGGDASAGDSSAPLDATGGDSADAAEVDGAQPCDCYPPHAIGRCVDGGCTVHGCLDGYLDCNGKVEDGCEVDPQSNVEHCGKCEHPCTVALHGTPICDEGECAADCEQGFLECDGDPINGCEKPIIGYTDADGDGWGVLTDFHLVCEITQGLSANPGDCDDQDNRVNPGQNGCFTEANPTVGFDYNCDGVITKCNTETGYCPSDGCPAKFGWEGSVPDCGKFGYYVDSIGMSNTCFCDDSQRQQSCQ